MGRYRPPDANPLKQPFNTTHPLGPRARRLASHGILVVRFELPFNVFCLHCSSHLAQGVRFNAEKQQVGEYLSTKIWGFGCKCPNCGGRFEIRTDPERAQYVVGEGVKRQAQEWDPEENGGHPIYDFSHREGDGGEDAFAKVEQHSKDTLKAKQRQKRIEELQEAQERTWSDTHGANARLRGLFRKDKRARVEQLERDLELKEKIGWREDSVVVARTPKSDERDGEAWKQAKSSAREEGSKTKSSASKTARGGATTAAQNLRARLVANTVKKHDPFLREMQQTSSSSSGSTAKKQKLVQARSSSSSR